MWHRHITGLLSAEECQRLIDRGLKQGFEAAKVNHYGDQTMMTQVRNNERLEFDDHVLAVELQNKLMIALGDDFPHVFANKDYAKAGTHFRMYRYTPGQYFKPHKDGSFQDGEFESEITVLFYLNDAQGGETVLMPYGVSQAWSHIVIQPRAGDVLLFEHNVWHEGRQVTAGEKFVLRTDLFYS
jgi:predicted 2-oxoglutarate/Fe(II)-dependent dioxygenase YbiX